MRVPLRIVHTADIHLGDDYRPDLARHAFDAVLGRTVSLGADLLIIAGDLFDSNRAAMIHIDFVVAALSRLPFPVVILPGNHDPIDDRSPYHSQASQLHEANSKVRLIRSVHGEALHFPEQRLTVWGKPVVEHLPSFAPIGNIPERGGDNWHVAVAHGFYVPENEKTDRSSPISQSEIARCGWDYVALGHNHLYQEIPCNGTIACYSGSPVRFSGFEKDMGHVALVDLDPYNGVHVQRVSATE